jgi:hypothetical protein
MKPEGSLPFSKASVVKHHEPTASMPKFTTCSSNFQLGTILVYKYRSSKRFLPPTSSNKNYTGISHFHLMLHASSMLFTLTVKIPQQSITSWTVVLSRHITRYTHTLTHIHIFPQNSRRWPLCKSVNVGIAAWNTAEKYLQEVPVRFPLWQWRFPISSDDWNRRPRSFSFKRGKKKKSHVARSGE